MEKYKELDRDIYLTEKIIGRKLTNLNRMEELTKGFLKYNIYKFSNWEAFGTMLWPWLIFQPFYKDFMIFAKFEGECDLQNNEQDWMDWMKFIIDPDRCANALYEYLKERDKNE